MESLPKNDHFQWHKCTQDTGWSFESMFQWYWKFIQLYTFYPNHFKTSTTWPIPFIGWFLFQGVKKRYQVFLATMSQIPETKTLLYQTVRPDPRSHHRLRWFWNQKTVKLMSQRRSWWLKSGIHQLRLGVFIYHLFTRFIHSRWLFGISSINSYQFPKQDFPWNSRPISFPKCYLLGRYNFQTCPSLHQRTREIPKAVPISKPTPGQVRHNEGGTGNTLVCLICHLKTS